MRIQPVLAKEENWQNLLFLLFFQRFFNNNIKQGSLGQGNKPAPKLVGKFGFTLNRRPKISLTPMLAGKPILHHKVHLRKALLMKDQRMTYTVHEVIHT